MPMTFVHLSVFISCPSDMVEERAVIRAAVDEVNSVLEPNKILLRAIDWENDLVPGIGPDPQLVINSQIQGNYDIYLGILGARFGTRTSRAGSGTEEEFRNALELYS